jgi:hypothetical protein
MTMQFRSQARASLDSRKLQRRAGQPPLNRQKRAWVGAPSTRKNRTRGPMYATSWPPRSIAQKSLLTLESSKERKGTPLHRIGRGPVYAISWTPTHSPEFYDP